MMELGKMSLMISLIAVGIVSFPAVSTIDECSPAEEGEEYNITLPESSSYTSKMLWDVIFRNGTILPLGNCTGFGKCTSYFPEYFDMSNTGKSGAILTIKNVSRIEPFDMETFDYWKGYSFNWREYFALCRLEYHVQLFVRPKTVCEQPRLIASEFSIEMNCTSERIYPAAMCQALISNDINDNASFTTVESIESDSKSYYESDVMYYTATCSFTLSLGQFETHGKYLKIKMYPNLKYISNVVDYGDDSDVFYIASLLAKEPSSDSSPLETAQIIGIAVGCLAALVFSTVAVVGLVRYIRRDSRERSGTEQSTSQTQNPQGDDGYITPIDNAYSMDYITPPEDYISPVDENIYSSADYADHLTLQPEITFTTPAHRRCRALTV